MEQDPEHWESTNLLFSGFLHIGEQSRHLKIFFQLFRFLGPLLCAKVGNLKSPKTHGSMDLEG